MYSRNYYVSQRQRSWSSCTTSLNPSKIRFSQDTIARRFRNGGLVNDAIIKVVRNKTLKVEDFPSIEVVKRKDGKYYTLDNRRLYVFRVAQIYDVVDTVSVRIVTEQPYHQRKFTSLNGGTEIRVRHAATYKHWESSWLQDSIQIEESPRTKKDVHQAYGIPRRATTASGVRSASRYSQYDEAQSEAATVRAYGDQYNLLNSKQSRDSDQKTVFAVPVRRFTMQKTKQEDDLDQKMKDLGIKDQTKYTQPALRTTTGRYSSSSTHVHSTKRIAMSRPQTASYVRPSSEKYGVVCEERPKKRPPAVDYVSAVRYTSLTDTEWDKLLRRVILAQREYGE